MTVYQGKIQVRHGTAASAASNNPTGSSGELGYDTDAKRLKVFDGVTPWNSLGWATDIPLVPPPSTGWTAFNSGSVTDSTDSRVITLASSAGYSWKGEVRTLSPASNYTATFFFDWALPSFTFALGGIILFNSGGSSLITFGPGFESSPAGFNMESLKWTNATTFSANYTVKEVWKLTNGIPNWLRIRDDSTTRFYEYSYNGVDWVLYDSQTRTDFLTPDRIGWGVCANNSGGTYTAITRLRHFVTS